MNEIQSKWRTVTLGQIVAPQKDREIPPKTTKLRYIGMEHVQAQSGNVIGEGRGADITSLSPRVRAGDVLYGRLRPYLNKVAISPEDAFASGEFIVFRGNEHLDARWLKWRLSAQDFVDFATALNTGDRPRVKWPQMAGFKLSLPAINEQREIVEILECHFSRLDSAEAGLRAAALRNRALVKSSAATLIGQTEVDESVPQVRLSDIAKIGSGSTPKRGVGKYWVDGTIPWITSGDLAQGVITVATQFLTEAALAETSVKIWPAGTLLVAMYGEGKTRGTVAELDLDATTNQACAAIRLNDSSPVLRAWVRLVLESRYDALRRESSGGVQPNLTLGYFKSLSLSLPEFTQAAALVDEHNAFVRRAQRLDQGIRGALDRSERLRHALLVAAFSGKLRGMGTDLERAEEMAGV